MAKNKNSRPRSVISVGKGLFVVTAIILLVLLPSLSCNSVDKSSFGIYLLDTDEIVLSGRDIQSYDVAESAFRLNQGGIKKWNSYIPSQSAPKLKDGLFSQDFVIKVEGRELCRGKFWSGVSSQMYNGVVIMDTIFRIDSEHNMLWIRSSYPGSNSLLEESISSELDKYLNQTN